MYQNEYHIHFVGIGGIGMSGIAKLLMNMGYKVSGSDLEISSITRGLEKSGARIYEGHKKENIKGADIIVTSTAILKENPEVVRAEKKSVPIISRAEMLAELMRMKYSIGISGAHGKTSTTSIISQILKEACFDPTVVIGGIIQGFETNVMDGKGNFMVVEADESDGSFLKYAPSIAVITNIDLEHIDFYQDIEDIKNKFIKFINSVPFYGLAILCADDEYIRALLPHINVRYTTFGINSGSDLQAKKIFLDGNKSCFKIFHHKKFLGDINLNIAGEHNVLNALAGIAAGLELKIPFKTIKATLGRIKGVKRRLEVKGEKKGITIVDDYAHHPTEIIATMKAIRKIYREKKLCVVFQPHRYTRTQGLFEEFTEVFTEVVRKSDPLIVLPIYAASEKKIEGVDSENLYRAIKAQGHKKVFYAPGFEQAVSTVKQEIRENYVVLTMGAGNVYRVAEKLIETL